MTNPATSDPNVAASAGLRQSLALLEAGAGAITKAAAKLGTAKHPQFATFATQIAGQVAAINAANETLQKATAAS